jgi:hypothetical protein
LAVACTVDGVVFFLVNDGTGAFTESKSAAVGTNPVAIEALDLDCDGDSDLAVATQSPDYVTILFNLAVGP